MPKPPKLSMNSGDKFYASNGVYNFIDKFKTEYQPRGRNGGRINEGSYNKILMRFAKAHEEVILHKKWRKGFWGYTENAAIVSAYHFDEFAKWMNKTYERV